VESGHTRPILIDKSGASVLLERVPVSGPGSSYDEAWLQDLLFQHPTALPIAEINDAFTGLIPVGREVNTPKGPIDVLYATASGRLVVVEAKLWRNPEARRKVIGQVLDYAKELSHFTYDDLDAAVRAASHRDRGARRSLFEIVRERHADLDEARFVDAVFRNLRRGDFLLLIVGDGIRENVGDIAHFIEDHGTFHFTFGLIEMGIYQAPGGSLVVCPRVQAQSTIIRRIVVETRNGELAEADEETSAVDSDEVPRPDLEESRRQFSEFWTEFLAAYPLDDSSQPLRPPAKNTNQNYHMPEESDAWVSAAVAQSSGQAGVYLTFRKGPISDRIYAALVADRPAIDEALGQNPRWSSTERHHSVSVWREFGSQMLTDHRAEVQAWLGDHVNRFINTFRPRIRSLLREQTE
jgi:hypothetical protein